MSNDRIGALRRRLRLQQQSRTATAGGAADVSWFDVAEVFASVEPISGREGALADGLADTVMHAVVVRHRSGITPAMRFVDGDRILDIQVVVDVGGHGRRLRCLCLERTP